MKNTKKESNELINIETALANIVGGNKITDLGRWIKGHPAKGAAVISGAVAATAVEAALIWTTVLYMFMLIHFKSKENTRTEKYTDRTVYVLSFHVFGGWE